MNTKLFQILTVMALMVFSVAIVDQVPAEVPLGYNIELVK
jgi:hypothetical protein